REPRPTSAVRWRCSGHTVFDNKQRAVRRYEPYFSPTHEIESDAALAEFGVTTVTTYDPLGRPIEVKFPNDTVARSHIGAWEVVHSDRNDTIADTDYRRVRESLPADDPERLALANALAHAGTPVRTHLDPVGRDVVVNEDGGVDGERRTETERDLGGQVTAVIDPRRLRAFEYRRDMLGRPLHEASIDSGEKWVLFDASGQPVHLWNAAGAHQVMERDALGRLRMLHVTEA